MFFFQSPPTTCCVTAELLKTAHKKYVWMPSLFLRWGGGGSGERGHSSSDHHTVHTSVYSRATIILSGDRWNFFTTLGLGSPAACGRSLYIFYAVFDRYCLNKNCLLQNLAVKILWRLERSYVKLLKIFKQREIVVAKRTNSSLNQKSFL